MQVNIHQRTISTVKEYYVIRLKGKDYPELKIMLDQLIYNHIYQARNHSQLMSEISRLILVEIEGLVDKKVKTIKNVDNERNLKLLPSQAMALMVWMNIYSFPHPWHETLSIKIVEQLDKQR